MQLKTRCNSGFLHVLFGPTYGGSLNLLVSTSLFQTSKNNKNRYHKVRRAFARSSAMKAIPYSPRNG